MDYYFILWREISLDDLDWGRQEASPQSFILTRSQLIFQPPFLNYVSYPIMNRPNPWRIRGYERVVP